MMRLKSKYNRETSVNCIKPYIYIYFFVILDTVEPVLSGHSRGMILNTGCTEYTIKVTFYVTFDNFILTLLRNCSDKMKKAENIV